jgi:hypothetical protein
MLFSSSSRLVVPYLSHHPQYDNWNAWRNVGNFKKERGPNPKTDLMDT